MRRGWTTSYIVVRTIAWPVIAACLTLTLFMLADPNAANSEYLGGIRVVNEG